MTDVHQRSCLSLNLGIIPFAGKEHVYLLHVCRPVYLGIFRSSQYRSVGFQIYLQGIFHITKRLNATSPRKRRKAVCQKYRRSNSNARTKSTVWLMRPFRCPKAGVNRLWRDICYSRSVVFLRNIFSWDILTTTHLNDSFGRPRRSHGHVDVPSCFPTVAEKCQQQTNSR